MDTVAIVSPHFDDAIFSVGGLMLKKQIAARVINVCGGIPQAGLQASSWDSRCGFRSAGEAAVLRAIEDAKAWSELPVECVNLPFLDWPYSNGTQSTAIAAALRQHLTGIRTVWAPASIGQHPDHIASRDAVLSLSVPLSFKIRLYADAPYSSARGWLTDDEDRDVAFRWETAFSSMRARGYNLGGLEAVALPEKLMAEKLARVSAYRSQLPQLKAYYPGIENNDGELSNEGLWDIVVNQR